MEELVLKFEPKTIEHLGVKMYSTLPPALAELISNAYDADASEIEVTFHEQNGTPVSIVVKDNGCGMSFSDIQSKFLAIGRDRRQTDGDKPSPKYGRLPTGKKGLGKLALFGIAKEIIIDTVKAGKRNRFTLDWDTLYSSEGQYRPKTEVIDEVSEKPDGTYIHLKKLKRKSKFDISSIADGLSRIFIMDDNFKINLKKTGGSQLEEETVKNERRFSQIDKEFSWNKNDLEVGDYKYANDVEFEFITSEKPIKPSSGLRGITIFSRGKLVNAPEFFSDSTSSHVFQYLTGWIRADFIDLLDEDVISTNRQSLNWEHDEMQVFRVWLQELVAKVSNDWRKKRKDKKDGDFKSQTGIDKDKWMSTLPSDIKKSVETIVKKLSDDEGVSESFNPVIQALYEIVPEYPELHWRHLHSSIKDRIKIYYDNQQYAEAADQGTKIYAQIVRDTSGSDKDGTKIAEVFSQNNTPLISVADLTTESGKNIQQGQEHLTRGVMAGFRNPMNHQPFDKLVPSTFSQLDCLNVLSLISYLTTRLDYASHEDEEKH